MQTHHRDYFNICAMQVSCRFEPFHMSGLPTECAPRAVFKNHPCTGIDRKILLKTVSPVYFSYNDGGAPDFMHAMTSV